MHCVTVGSLRDQFQKILLTLSRDADTRTLISRTTSSRGLTWDTNSLTAFLLSVLISSKKVPIPLSPTSTPSPPPALLLLLCYFRIKSPSWVVKQTYTDLNFRWSINLMKCCACMYPCNYHQVQYIEHSSTWYIPHAFCWYFLLHDF